MTNHVWLVILTNFDKFLELTQVTAPCVVDIFLSLFRCDLSFLYAWVLCLPWGGLRLRRGR